jgi:hypothetical protein
MRRDAVGPDKRVCGLETVVCDMLFAAAMKRKRGLGLCIDGYGAHTLQVLRAGQMAVSSGSSMQAWAPRRRAMRNLP